MRLYRCMNPICSESEYVTRFDFLSQEPKCPKCGADKRDPESQHLIAGLATIHLTPLSKWGKGTMTYACTGQRFGRDMATGDPKQVNCPACKETALWKQLVEAWGYEVITEITPERAKELRAAAALAVRPVGSVP